MFGCSSHLALAVTVALAGVAAPASATEPVSLKIILDQWESGSGSRSAGVFCMPNGNYENEEFAPLIPVVESALLNIALTPSLPEGAVSVDYFILKVKMKLCAKKYGVLGKGQARAMTGMATFHTLLKVRNASGEIIAEKLCEFTFADHKKKPSSDSVIFSEGLSAAYQHCLDNA